MRLTATTLRRIIKEETRRVLLESAPKMEINRINDILEDGIREIERALERDPDEAKHDATVAVDDLHDDLKRAIGKLQDALHDWVAEELAEKHGR